MTIDPDHREQIEAWLGRRLTDSELRPVESLGSLSDDQLAVVVAIRPRNLIAPQLYVRAIVPSASYAEVRRFVDDIADRNPPDDAEHFAVFERYLDRPLDPAEKVTVTGLDALSSAHVAVATRLAHHDVAIAFLYLRRIVPEASIEASSALAKRLAA